MNGTDFHTTEPLTALTARFFAEGGPLCQANPHYTPRAGQQELTQAIADCFLDGGVLLGEAGCGVGKSYAYLVPALLAALQGKVTVIATHTKALQEQLMQNDLPRLLALFPKDSIRVACLKGRSNYLCRAEMDCAAEDLARMADPAFRRLQAETNSPFYIGPDWDGDLSTLGYPVKDQHELTSTHESCTGERCPLYHKCYFYAAKHKAREAHVLIVNQALLLKDAELKANSSTGHGLLPDYDYLVIDEAHHLHDVCDGAATVRLTPGRLQHLAQRLGKLPNPPLIHTELGEIINQTEDLFDPLNGVTKAQELTETQQQELEGFAAPLFRLLDTAQANLTHLLPKDTWTALTPVQHKAMGLKNTILRLTMDMVEVLAPLKLGTVRYAEPDRTSVALCATPLDVASMLKQYLWAPLECRDGAVCLVSATLATESGFDYPLKQLGLDCVHSTMLNTLQVASPFDFQRNALLYVPAHVPAPKSTSDACLQLAQHDEMLRLCQLTSGRAFLLFTSWRSLQAAKQAFSEHKFPLFCQGDMPHRKLLDGFLASKNGVLLGVASFWEGVDVPGDALSLVTMDKLPFSPNDHPVTQAREKLHEKNGGNAFADLSIPQAQIKLKQGFGRLIRTVTDRGIVAILDTRLLTKGYGGRFVKSLPPCQKASKWGGVMKFWQSAQICADSGEGE